MQFQQAHGVPRKQIMPVNTTADTSLNSLPQQEIVSFVYYHIRRALREKKSIEIEGKLGWFIPKSASNQDKAQTMIKINTLDIASQQTVLMLKPFEHLLHFESATDQRVHDDQVKYFDWASKQSGAASEFSEKAELQFIVDADSFEQCQNDITVDFSFEDGTRLKVPIAATSPATLDKKDRAAENNLNFIFQGYHYRISAREEEEITDRDKVNEKLLAVKEGNFIGARIKYRKAYRYLFMEFAFTKVLSIRKVNKKVRLDALDQAEMELFEEFSKGPAQFVLSRQKFGRHSLRFFQKAFDLKYHEHTKYETEVEIKELNKHFGHLFAAEENPANAAQIQSNIRSFVRNLISLNSTSTFFGQFYSQTIKVKDENGNYNRNVTTYKPNILGQYLENN